MTPLGSLVNVFSKDMDTLDALLPRLLASQTLKAAIIRVDEPRLSGTLPAELTKLAKLTQLDIATNMLSGTVPESMCKLVQNLSAGCNFGSNPLACPLPSCNATLKDKCAVSCALSPPSPPCRHPSRHSGQQSPVRSLPSSDQRPSGW